MTVEYLSIGQVLALHAQQLKRYGGGRGVRDRGALESALARPAATFDGEDLYPDIADKSAAPKRYLNFGASPRASLALYQSGRALAWLRGQDFVSPALIQDLAPDVLRHRIGLTYEAEAEDITADRIIRQVIERTPVPAT